MISIIICSAKEQLADLVCNIEQSVGVECEVIVIENVGAKYSIAQAYNLGIQKSKYKYTCFIHDDVKILSIDWGLKLISEWNSMENPGLIGVIGAQYKSIFPSPWTCPDINLNKGQIWQYPKHSKVNGYLLSYSAYKTPVEVVVVDGVFLFSSKSNLTEVDGFDENLIGFHCYDTSLALKMNFAGKKVFVSHSLLLEHYSEGKLNNDWFKNQLYLVKKWRLELPLNSNSPKRINYDLEAKCFKRSVYVFIKNQVSLKIRMQYALFYVFFNRIPLQQYIKIVFKTFKSFISSNQKSEVS